MNKSLKGCLILTLLLLLAMGVASAADVSDDTGADNIQQVEQVSKDTTSIQKNDIISNENYVKKNNNSKEINKIEEKKR
jgi:hypothetical protein